MSKVYTTIQGDTWDFISYKEYGTEMVMDKLIQANLDLADIVIFSAGVRITLPTIDTTLKKEGKPPWAR